MKKKIRCQQSATESFSRTCFGDSAYNCTYVVPSSFLWCYVFSNTIMRVLVEETLLHIRDLENTTLSDMATTTIPHANTGH